jgi:hypothetical protein
MVLLDLAGVRDLHLMAGVETGEGNDSMGLDPPSDEGWVGIGFTGMVPPSDEGWGGTLLTGSLDLDGTTLAGLALDLTSPSWYKAACCTVGRSKGVGERLLDLIIGGEGERLSDPTDVDQNDLSYRTTRSGIMS